MSGQELLSAKLYNVQALLLYGFPQGDQKHDALARGVGREKLRHIVVEEGESRRAQTLGVGSKVESSAQDGGFDLGRAIAAVAEALQSAIEIRQKVNIDAAIGGDFLA